MKKGLDSEIMLELLQLAIEKKIDFKKWFQDEEMMLESVPVSIYELLTVLPLFYVYKDKEAPMTGVFMEYHQCAKQWVVGYEHCVDFDQEHLVDALGKLLIWCIKEGWVG